MKKNLVGTRAFVGPLSRMMPTLRPSRWQRLLRYLAPNETALAHLHSLGWVLFAALVWFVLGLVIPACTTAKAKPARPLISLTKEPQHPRYSPYQWQETH